MKEERRCRRSETGEGWSWFINFYLSVNSSFRIGYGSAGRDHGGTRRNTPKCNTLL